MKAATFLNVLIAAQAVTLADGQYKVDEDKFQLIWNEKELNDRAYISSVEIDDTEIKFNGRCVGSHCSYPGTFRFKLDRFNDNDFKLVQVA